MSNQEPLLPNSFYHIYNRELTVAIFFESEENNQYFLNLYAKYIAPIAATYAWVLMPNHFHLLIKTKSNIEKPLHQYFSNLFNAYTKAFNKFNERHGALFERPFKRKQINNPIYFKRVVIYIHQNPVHHGFCEHPLEYGWSSYLSCVSEKETMLERKEVLRWFGNRHVFRTNHNDKINPFEVEALLNL